MQNHQYRHPHRWGATEGQDEAHGAPDPEANEDERDEDQLLIGHGGVVLELVYVGDDGPVLRELLALCRKAESRLEISDVSWGPPPHSLPCPWVAVSPLLLGTHTGWSRRT